MLTANFTSALADELASRMFALTGSDSPAHWRETLEGVCAGEAIETWLGRSGDEWSREQPRFDGTDDLISPDLRRRHGIYFTPDSVASEMASRLEGGRVVLDPACGDGALLEAVLARDPIRIVGVEQSPELVVASAIRLLHTQTSTPFFIHWDDGLNAHHWESVDSVIANPPYVAEKGNAALFAKLRRKHRDLKEAFQPRMDLFYLFVERAAQSGVPSVFLTSDYWLTATGAEHMRSAIRRCGLKAVERLGGGLFSSARGHHSLLFELGSRGEWVPPNEGPWHPFAKIPKREGPKLHDVLDDFQGVVSGADRVTSRNAALCNAPVGTPIFVRPTQSEGLWKPLLRARQLEPNEILVDPVKSDSMLYVDGSETDEARSDLEQILEPFRALLTKRREVQNGSMHWTRLHWPRQRQRFLGPKLVVPRRAKSCRFALDLAGHVVSSDCTVLTLRSQVAVVRSLVHLMVVLNTVDTYEQLFEYGKRKGELVEFYSAPLRDLALPVLATPEGVVAANTAEFEAAEALYVSVEGKLP